MSLQRFKLDVANAVVNTDNASMKSMDTGAMLELFTAEKGKKAKLEAEKKEGHVAGGGEGRGEEHTQTQKQVLSGLDELWRRVNTTKNSTSSSFGRLLRNNNNTILPGDDHHHHHRHDDDADDADERFRVERGRKRKMISNECEYNEREREREREVYASPKRYRALIKKKKAL